MSGKRRSTPFVCLSRLPGNNLLDSTYCCCKGSGLGHRRWKNSFDDSKTW